MFRDYRPSHSPPSPHTLLHTQRTVRRCFSSVAEATAPREGPRLDDGLGWNGDEAVPLDPTVGGEVNGSVPKVIIKALIEGPVRKALVPVIGLGPGISFFSTRFADGIEVPAEVPLAEATRAVALFLEHLGDGEILGLEDGSVEGPDNAVEAAPVVLPECSAP